MHIVVAFFCSMEEDVTPSHRLIKSLSLLALFIKSPSVRRELCKHTQRVWEVRSVRPNHLKQLGGGRGSCHFKKNPTSKIIQYQLK